MDSAAVKVCWSHIFHGEIMADRIDKTRLGPLEPFEAYQVEASRDALDEEKQKKQEGDDDEQPKNQDAFRKPVAKPLEAAKLRHAPKQTVELALDDIKQAWLHGIDLKTEPSTLFLKLQLQNATDILLVTTSVSRGLALSFKSKSANKPIALRHYFKTPTIWVQIHENWAETEEEITRISKVFSQAGSTEKTLSQTFKLGTTGNFLERIGVLTPDAKRLNLEVVLAYLIALIVCLFLFFGILYLST